MDSLTVKAAAKVNLRLKILRKRADGYHEISTLFQKVGLFDEISFRKTPAPGIHLTVTSPALPSDRSNLVYRAAELLLREAGITHGVAIHLIKSIPAGAGLGGGSSDAAATLHGINSLFDLKIENRRLEDMALSLGADVPFFLAPYPTACATGVGEILEPAHITPELWFVIIYPRFSISTAWAYAAYSKDNLLTNQQKINKMLYSIDALEQVHLLLHNDFERVVIPRYPEIAAIKQRLMETGARGALLSGSGSAVFGVFATCQQCQLAAAEFSAAEPYDVFTAPGLR